MTPLAFTPKLFSNSRSVENSRTANEPSDQNPNQARYLVDRLWPRGVNKDALHLADWLKEVAPSDLLRRWFGHDPARWPEFRRRYRGELKSKRAALQPLRDALKRGTVTLMFSARDEEHNQAVVLREFLAVRRAKTIIANQRR